MTQRRTEAVSPRATESGKSCLRIFFRLLWSKCRRVRMDDPEAAHSFGLANAPASGADTSGVDASSALPAQESIDGPDQAGVTLPTMDTAHEAAAASDYPDVDPDEISPEKLLAPSHPTTDGADPDNREWWTLWKRASRQAEYERADWIQSRNITALLTVRDVLLIFITCVAIVATIVLAHTLTLWRRYPVQHAWYFSKPMQRNFVGAKGVATMPAFDTPSFMELALNNTYPALLPYLAPLGYRQYPAQMVEFILFIIAIAGGNLNQRSMGGIPKSDIKTYLIDVSTQISPWPPPSKGGSTGPWAKAYQLMWEAWSTMSTQPVGHANPFFWMFPTKTSFCTSVLVNEWIDTGFDYASTGTTLLNVMEMGFSEWARDRAVAGLNVQRMFSTLFASIDLNVSVSVDCQPLIDAANIQEGGEIASGVIGAVMLTTMIGFTPAGWVVAGLVGGIALGFAIWGAMSGADERRRKAIATCKQQYYTLVGTAAYNACVVFSARSGPDAINYCQNELAQWTAWAKRILPPPKNAG